MRVIRESLGCWVVAAVLVGCGVEPEAAEGGDELGGSTESETGTDSETETETSSSSESSGESTETETETETSGETDTGEGCPVWCPPPGTTWQWQLVGALDTRFEVEAYDIDLFDNEAQAVADLQAQGRAVICYFSAGSFEDWRPDADAFPPAALGEPLDGWPGERWLDVRDETIRDIMRARLDLAVERGCDAVEPDNVDGYINDSGFPLTASDQLDYNRFLAEEAHARELSVGLKNDLEQIPELVDDFDWALDEECLAWDECALLQPFLDAGKAVFHVEYVDEPEQGQAAAEALCPQVPAGFSSLIKTWDLDPWVIPC